MYRSLLFLHFTIQLEAFRNLNLRYQSKATNLKSTIQSRAIGSSSLSSYSTLSFASISSNEIGSTQQDEKQFSSNPSQLKMIVDERREFEMNVGKAVDTLRKDYPKILENCLDYSIYHENLEVIDPSGVKLHGLQNYKNFFHVLRAIISLFYCSEKSGLTFRLIFDWARNNIRVSWRAVLIPKAIYGGVRHPLYVDGISVYETNRDGIITQHRVEDLLINDHPVTVPNGIFAAVTNEANGIPVLGLNTGSGTISTNAHISFSSNFRMAFSGEAASTSNPESFKERNHYRKKYGLKPLTPEEFEEVEAKTRLLEEETQLRREQAAAAAAATSSDSKKKNGFFSELFTDNCESNFDCERPQVCCDLIFKKICCSNGMKVHSNNVLGNPALVPVPARPDTPFPDYY